jgi:hypothetical protein
MRIDAITVCVGREYESYLTDTMKIWLDTLDSLTVITKPGDRILKFKKNKPKNLNLVETDIFTDYKAYFNKGAALCEGYRVANPTDWVLHVDSDIIPPMNWRMIAEKKARKDCLSGAFRFSKAGIRLDEKPLYPYGYFHLWHSSDKNSWRWPLFEPWYGHAGSYDANFTDQWPSSKRADLGFELIHQGERRTNWFGPGAHKGLMAGLLRMGLRRARLLSNKTGLGKLKVPEPKLKFWFSLTSDIAWVEKVLYECRQEGPFNVYARGTNFQPNKSWVYISKETDSIASIKDRIYSCLYRIK